MRKTITFLFSLLFALNLSANEPLTYLTIWAKDGTTVAYALSEKPKITFEDEYLIINTEIVEVKYALNNLSHFIYDYSALTGLINLQDDSKFELKNDALIFSCLPKNSTINIFTTEGKKVSTNNISNGGNYAISIAFLPIGCYIVNVNGLTYKILKR